MSQDSSIQDWLLDSRPCLFDLLGGLMQVLCQSRDPAARTQVIVMEYAANGQLAERIDTSGPLDEALARRLYRQLIDGMAYSHAQVRLHMRTRFAQGPS